jgi:cytochrome c oxidase assembly factor CtaG
MPVGLIIIVAVLMALGMPRSRLSLPVPDASRRAGSLAWRLRMRQR